MERYQSRRYGSSHIERSQSEQDSSNEEDILENDGPVFKTIQAIRDQDCAKLKGLLGELSQKEEIHKGLRQLYDSKKCLLIDTEYNYQIFRNLELSVGVELTQASLEIKQNIATYIGLSNNLATALKNVVKAAKDAKQKFSDLRKAGCDLNICINDKCNCNQILILTGKSPCNGGDDHNKRPVKPACPGSEDTLKHLVEEPEVFFKDSDIILNSAADITGIQTFTNITSLDSLQQGLAANITAFDGVVTAKMTQGATDLAQCQTDLVAAIKELTTSEHALYNKRDEIDAERETIEYICEYECECIREEGDDRLKDCKNDICDICEQLDDIYCERHKHHHNNEKTTQM
jgi:hypothetical protein